MEIDCGQARRRAKELLRATRAGDPDALARLRDDRAPRLADAQRAVAAELGFASWSALIDAAATRDDDAGRSGGTELETGLDYVPGRPVRVRLRRRGRRYDFDDMGGAIALAGRPSGWLPVAQRAVEELGWNVNRRGVVFMQAVEGRDVDRLVRRTGEASVAVLTALLTLQE